MTYESKPSMNRVVRKGIKDVWWNAYMVRGAKFSPSDIPYCPTTAKSPPSMIITYEEAKAIHRRESRKKNYGYLHMAYVSFYQDDYTEDNTQGIWFQSERAYMVLEYLSGIITPDFSTYQDFPAPLKLWNTYRMRAFGYWYGTLCGHNVINNVRWGTAETYSYCFDGIPKNSMVAVATTGGSPRKLSNRARFEAGLAEMVTRLSPHTIIVYGSANFPCFSDLVKKGISIVTYPSRASLAFNKEYNKEQIS